MPPVVDWNSLLTDLHEINEKVSMPYQQNQVYVAFDLIHYKDFLTYLSEEQRVKEIFERFKSYNPAPGEWIVSAKVDKDPARVSFRFTRNPYS